ncbi:Alpha/Beta hydrolase protein [Aspergillus cavernicola]|uniref:Alpha/Beta hydrolase protein n=1 Tax=Aspergillus cavernicola TaxID=176166 RepID=A0ABR4IP35_9EURO
MPLQSYPYKSFGEGQQIHATVHWPDVKQKTPCGIALAFHGGGFVVGSRDMIPTAQIQYLVDSGFVFVSADYRLCPQVPLYDGPIEDAKDAYSWSKNLLPGLLEEADIDVDPTTIVALGYSAGGLLALHLGALPNPPRAILDFYGVKYTSDSFWFKPLPALAMIPTLDDAFMNKIYEEPVLSTTILSLERASAEAAHQARPKTKGLPKPDLSIPRNAWLFVSLKLGTHFASIVQDGDYERVDPVRGFSEGFPPTFFVHGNADGMVLPDFSVRAYEELKELGVDTGLGLPEGKSHGFDVGVEVDDADFESIKAGLDFLIRHK